MLRTQRTINGGYNEMTEIHENPTNPAKTDRLAAWKGAKQHTVTLPSGTVVEIVLPNLPKMLQAGDVPNTLIAAALEAARGGEVTEETIREQFEFYRFLVARTVVEPQLDPSDVGDLPAEDIEMLVELASRNRDVDAVGHQLAGLERQADWRRFRGFDGGSAFGAGL
jgi:hypothetical protein